MWFYKILLILLVFPSCICLDTLTLNQAIKDGDELVSGREIFTLGFFSPGNSRNRYVGVWYNRISNKTVVWIANRDNPVPDTSGVLSLNGNGGLVIYGNNQSSPLWSANVTLSSPNTSIAKLLDTGNLVLLENEYSQKVIWQGFDYPTDTILPYMKLGLNRRSGLNSFLTSWKKEDDPGTGSCSFRLDNPNGFPQMIVYKEGAPWWRGAVASWAYQGWGMVTTLVNNEDEVSIMSYAKNNLSNFSRTVLDESGTLGRLTWNDRAHQWTQYWFAPIEHCDFYAQCGPNGNCDPYATDTIGCICLPGFEPKSPSDWYARDGKNGCVKRKGGVSICRNGEKFVNLESVKIPDMSNALVNMNVSMKDCKQTCLMNCSCVAYSSSDKTGCVTWYGDLMDTRVLPDAGQALYVRVDPIVFAQYAKKSNDSLSKKEKLAISLASVLALFLLVSLVYWLQKRKRRGKRSRNEYSFSSFKESTVEPDESSIRSDLPFFDLTTIAAATNNFSVANKLGTGGFGSVYKGVLSNGKEIAVKRLSKTSGQGIEEFKNEVVLIAKLQHRNLVRILGYCVQDEEKMLVYEYLPNKGLDYFIFNDTNRALLDWTRRFEIIHGITRGLLYLHQDSRLRIIHRDLKASNVLLDASMNPKIADFGMARIFRGDQNEANTKRVVGTYGYMSPEYAMRGRFSVKSDVYSFGVLLIEIITGRKNYGFCHEDNPDSNLVGYVWKSWTEGNVLQIVDSSIGDSCPINEVVKCIQIAFLCVQEYPADRPTMSEVLFMLGSDAALPLPQRPAFLLERSSSYIGSREGSNSLNDLTCSVVEAR